MSLTKKKQDALISELVAVEKREALSADGSRKSDSNRRKEIRELVIKRAKDA